MNGMGYGHNRGQKFLHLSIVTIFLLCVSFPFGLVRAETDEEKALRETLRKREEEIRIQQQKLNGAKQEQGQVQGEVNSLSGVIKQTKSKIYQKQKEMNVLSVDISHKAKTVTELEAKLENDIGVLKDILRNIRELDDVSIAEVVLGSDNIGDLFVEIDSFDDIKLSLYQNVKLVEQEKEATRQAKLALETNRSKLSYIKRSLELQKEQVENDKQTKERLLKLKKENVQAYAKLVAEKKAEVAAIKARLFSLRDVQNTKGVATGGISFAQALGYAEQASARTGVRTAFILGILQQESNIGKNVGKCNRPSDPPKKHYQRFMHPTRDIPAYLRITKKLGLDPNNQPLSCPLSTGYGGAMGPSQFIPSTWEMYESQITAVTGHNPPNPWNAADAFAGTASMLRDLGAAKGTYAAEREAAARYYAGGAWASRGLGYADSVLRHAQNIQTTMIDPIKKANLYK